MCRRNGNRYKEFFVVVLILLACFLMGSVIEEKNVEPDAFTDSIYWIGG